MYPCTIIKYSGKICKKNTAEMFFFAAVRLLSERLFLFTNVEEKLKCLYRENEGSSQAGVEEETNDFI